jgi:hypothetical protein
MKLLSHLFPLSATYNFLNSWCQLKRFEISGVFTFLSGFWKTKSEGLSHRYRVGRGKPIRREAIRSLDQEEVDEWTKNQKLLEIQKALGA